MADAQLNIPYLFLPPRTAGALAAMSTAADS